MYYDTEQPIPLETEWVARRLRVGVESVTAVLRDFFSREERGWVHARCEREIEAYHRRAEKNRANGRHGGRRKNPMGSESVASGIPTQSQGQANQEPITNNQEPTTKEIQADKPAVRVRAAVLAQRPDDVSEATWTDYLAIRKAKRSPLTTTALETIRREAFAAGWSLEAAIRECCARGWQGFKAEWVAGRQQDTGETPYQRSMRERMAEFAPGVAARPPRGHEPAGLVIDAFDVLPRLEG